MTGTAPAPIRVLSYNIHKGFNANRRRYILKKLKTSIERVRADVVLLQEVVGHHDDHRPHMEEDWPTTAQFEFLADRIWPHFAYGKNAIYTEGHHGNAILSRFPITFSENFDVSQNSVERRGLLHAVLDIPNAKLPLHVICLHLSLFERDRRTQVQQLSARIGAMVPDGVPVIVGGDFNDWRQRASSVLETELGLEEAFLVRTGKHAKTFPSWFPIFRLDRLYSRGLHCSSSRLAKGRVWRELSDHLPIVAEFSSLQK